MYEPIEQLYMLHYYELSRFLAKYTSSPEMIDDIIQSTFLEALKHIESFQGRSSMKTWLFGIARHQLYRYFRKNKSHVNIEDLSEDKLAEDHDFSDGLLAQQILERIDELTSPHQEIMRLRLVYGLSFKEIGMKIHRSETYCRVNFYRMKEKLRKEYEDE